MNLTAYKMQERKVLSHEDLMKSAPSIFAEKPQDGVSDKYSFVPTIQVIEQIENQGWKVVNAREQRVNNLERKGYQKHIIKFQRDDLMVEGLCPEIVLTNSHDRTSVFCFAAGLYRLVCSNGLIAFDPMFGQMKIKHIGYNNSHVKNITNQIVDQVPKVLSKVEELKNMELSHQEQIAFSISAAMEKWKVEQNQLPFDAERLLISRRSVDNQNTLWHTYNRVQENLMRGGVRYFSNDKEGRMSRKTTRAITSINEDVRVNKALWTLADNMRKIKNGETIG